MDTTVITAFYPIRSKFPPQQYLEWAARFLTLKAPIVLFTEDHLVDTFKAMRPPTYPLHIITKPFHLLDMWALYESQWNTQHTKDPEASYHTPELYALWAQKPVFVADAIQANPFATPYFYWCDIGAFRDPAIPQEVLTTFPQSALFAKYPTSILLNSVAPLEPKEYQTRNFLTVNRIVGGLWGGTATACLRWRSAFEAQLIQFFHTGRFAGKDQSVMLCAYLDDPTLAVIAKPTTAQGDHWFFQQYLLSVPTSPAVQPPFELDASYSIVGPPPIPPVTVQLMGGLGNQLFQIATAYTYARKQGGRLVLFPTKREDDGRPLYWDSVFHRFQHVLQAPFFIKPSWWEPAATEYAAIPPLSDLGMRLQGYFQSPKYFNKLSKELRSLFRPSVAVLKQIRQTYSDLLEMKERVVVIHARRGDYLKAPEHHGPLSIDYYRKAMETIKIKHPLYLLVSDEPMWWMENLAHLPALQTHSFQILMETDEITTFGLLQHFQHFIVANSSFSWWAAWMAKARHVVAPAQWFGPTGPKQWEDIYMQKWIRI